MASRFLTIRRHIRQFSYTIMMIAALGLPGVPVAQAGNSTIAVETETAIHNFSVEIMRTPEDRARGLMHRKTLDKDHGMLFDFGRNVIARMWMKNTFIPLDMMFIRDNGRIANIAENTVPHSTDVLSSNGKVRYVLEINGGLSRQLGISDGDQLILPKQN